MSKFDTPNAHYSNTSRPLSSYEVEDRQVQEADIVDGFSNACSRLGTRFPKDEIARYVVRSFRLKFAAIRDSATERAILCLSSQGPQHADLFYNGVSWHFKPEDAPFFIGAGEISGDDLQWGSHSCSSEPDIKRDRPEWRIEDEEVQIIAAYKIWQEMSAAKLLE